MTTVWARIAAVVVVVACLVLIPGSSSAAGVARLETEQNIVPPSYGGVTYRGGIGNNQVKVVRFPDSGVRIDDPLVLIIAYHVTLGEQNCTSDLGAASCRYATHLSVLTEDGDDMVNITDGFGFSSIFVDCGPGFDRAIVPVGTNVQPTCEVVQFK